jgi:S-layer family protein
VRKLKVVLSIILILTFIVSNSFAIALPNVSTSGNVVNISGKLEESNTNTTLIILDSDGTRQYLDQKKTDSEGNFNFKFNLVDGNYTGKISTELNQYELNFKVDSGTSQGPDSGGTDNSSDNNGAGNSGNSNTSSGEQITNEVAKVRKSFKDIENHWARNEIELLAGKGIVSGMVDGCFNPEEKITRAQFATMTFNIMELEKEEYSGKFVDVKSSDWFSLYVEAVAKIGVVLGSQDRFYPNNNITREEMAVIIVRVMEQKGISVMSNQVSFADKDNISSWAVESVSKAVDKKIIKGMTDITFEPKQNATRAQASVMLYRLMELLGSI